MINLIANIFYSVFTVRHRQHNLGLPLKRVMIELFLFHQYSCYLDFHHFPRLRFRRIYAYRALQHLRFLHTPAIPIYFYKNFENKIFYSPRRSTSSYGIFEFRLFSLFDFGENASRDDQRIGKFAF